MVAADRNSPTRKRARVAVMQEKAMKEVTRKGGSMKATLAQGKSNSMGEGKGFASVSVQRSFGGGLGSQRQNRSPFDCRTWFDEWLFVAREGRAILFEVLSCAQSILLY